MKPNRVALYVAALALLSGCTGGGGGNGDDVKQVHPAEAIEIARGYADDVLALAKGDQERANPADGTAPCEGRRGELSETVYHAWVGVTVAPVPEEQQLPTLRRLREHWQQQGYTIKSDRVFSAGRRGEVVVENPADDFEISVTSTDPPTAYAVRVSSPCYRSDEPYRPAPTTTSTPRRQSPMPGPGDRRTQHR